MMKPRNGFHYKCILVLGAVLAGLPMSASAKGSVVRAKNRRIAAVAPVLKPEENNGSYLKNVAGGPEKQEGQVNTAIFDKTISAEMTEKFKSFNAPYEARQPYQLNSPADVLRYEQSNKDLAEWTIKKLLQYHFENTLTHRVEESAKRAVKESQSSEAKGAAQAVMAVASVQKALKNTTFDLGANTKTRFKYDFPSGMMRAGMTSPIVNATMDYRLKAATPVVGSVDQPEKLSLNVSRSLDFIKASTTVNYGLVAQTMSYELNKQLVGSLSAQIDHISNMRDSSKDESLFRLNFGASF